MRPRIPRPPSSTARSRHDVLKPGERIGANRSAAAARTAGPFYGNSGAGLVRRSDGTRWRQPRGFRALAALGEPLQLGVLEGERVDGEGQGVRQRGRVGAGRVGCAEERAEAGEQLGLLVSGVGGGDLGGLGGLGGGLGGGPRDLYVRIWKVSELITIGAAAPIALGRALKVGIVAPAPLRKWEEAP